MDSYALGPDDQACGPADEAALRRWAGEGRLFPQTPLTDAARSRVFPAGDVLPASGLAGGGLGCLLSAFLLVGAGLLSGLLGSRFPALSAGPGFVVLAALLYAGGASGLYFALRRHTPALARGTTSR